MHMMIVKAIADGSGPDITGRIVPMPAGSYHLCREDDRSWFEQRSDVFSFVTQRDDSLVPTAYKLDASGNVTGLVGPDGSVIASIVARTAILNGASAGTDSGWIPISPNPERFAYQLDSGTTTTTFSVDISADGSTSLGQAFTGTYASSTVAEITFPIMFSNPLAKFFRWNVLSGGPLSVSRGV